MESYLILPCIGILVIVLIFFSARKNKSKKPEETIYISPLLEKNIRSLKECDCTYGPNMTIQLSPLKNEKKYNEMTSALEDKIYELDMLFNKLRYTVERTKFGEFLTASDIFKFIIEEKDIEECIKYVDTKIDLEKEIKDFKSRKKEVENLLQDLLDRSIKIKEKYKK